MKFLLVGINSKYIHSNPALYSLKAYTQKKHPNTVFIREFTINNPFDYILEEIYSELPDAIGISCYIWNISLVKRLIVELNKLLPDVEIYLGGPEVTYCAKDYIDNYPFLNGIFIGEGEETFLDLLDTFSYMEDPDFTDSFGGTIESIAFEVPGLMTHEGDYIPRERADFNSMPFIYSDKMLNEDFEHRIIYYESQRGCPFSCSYCLSSIDKGMRFRSLTKVKNEIQFFLDRKVPQVKFIDRTFNCSSVRTLELLEYLRDNDNGVTNFHFEIAADILTPEEIAVLQDLRPGYVQLEIGVQTTNLQTLKAINRPCKLDVLKDNVKMLLKNHNLHIHLDLIAGLPYEDLDSFINSFNDVYNMNPNQLQLGFLKVLKGTDIDLHQAEYGLNHEEEPPYEVLSTNWISYLELRMLKRVEEMVELYYNSAQFVTTVPLLCKYFKTPFELYKALADHYEKHNYFVMSPKRFRKYEILLEFAEEMIELNKERALNIPSLEDIRSALTFDYYLRENPKSKPDFVRELPTVTFDYEHRDPITQNATYYTTVS